MRRLGLDQYSLKILELNRVGNMLHIGIRIKCPYSPVVKEPKIAIIFDNGTQTRRLPLLAQAYFPAEDLTYCTIFAKYSYSLAYLFFGEPENKEIRFWIEFTYGDNVIDKMDFIISSDVHLEEDEEYEISHTDHQFVLKRLQEITKPSKVAAVKGAVQSIVGGIWTTLLTIVAICLVPVYLFEAILVLLGCAKNMPKNKKSGLLKIINHVRLRINRFTRKGFGITDSKEMVLQFAYNLAKNKEVKRNRIVFISNRRNDMSGNFEFVYDILKKDKSLDMRFVLDDRGIKQMSYANAFRYGYYCATSKVILVDDYAGLLYKIPRRPGTTMMQLWHACGAFKTFGYSRLGKPGGQKQTSPAHRNYDYCIVSSKEIAKYYAEGFGISLEKPIATGIPRTDIFFDEAYKKQATESFYQMYPKLKNKKILLFAPTFRGNGKMSGFYPVEKFDVAKLYEELGGEYAIIIKHHPFVQDRNEIPEKYEDFILDMSENSELNDLLFVTDVLVSDYSSVIFEAALLDIPMLFYAYDLQRYISSRGFYYEYEDFVPGKIVSSFAQAVSAIKKRDFEVE
ncbi:MAG: CDP-ribitol ribitolphosphotransferase / teichoic acid ribitol-phosphate polymerase, partial [Clostridiales bacterium]|nr:CDP-ribitol ribitolphosphotransferase / teichoic acid ribitol-phosphate polymerase [Clostridiales bacterium]